MLADLGHLLKAEAGHHQRAKDATEVLSPPSHITPYHLQMLADLDDLLKAEAGHHQRAKDATEVRKGLERQVLHLFLLHYSEA